MYQPLPTNEDADVEAYGRLRQGFAEALTEQDKGIDELAKIISRQKTIATSIGTEVVSQNDLIDGITDQSDRTRDRLMRQTDNVIATGKKDVTWPYWLAIVLLFIGIIVVSSLPKL
ncbi:syntaxin-8-like [Artemia franciscana]|uniref:t-SNARE coiled-coil homology domain-containing protein n=1 Tax=Artemia franciscana TaxID=6661 RepID=A0AA88LEV2_ARTSF|nr:hypothetical protein QYM36_008427 [Artemia franciscana]KAK2727947.1 hypothetical protein QYM36_008427 [Artemia franciscana]